MDAFRLNLKHALRSLLRSPGVLLVATLSLALGISVNTTIFSAVDVFLIRPLPYPDPDRIVQVWSTNQERGSRSLSASLPDYLDWRTAASSVDLAGFRGAAFDLSGTEQPERLSALGISANFFRVLGAQPVLGRSFREDEERVGNDRVVVISHAFWQSHLAGDAQVINKTLTLNGEAYTIVGVMPADFRFDSPFTQIWAPLGLTGQEVRSMHNLNVIGRLRAGSSMEAAQAELKTVASRLESAYPESNRGNGVRMLRLKDEMFDENFWTASIICSVAVAFVLLIACANVANLLLVRASAREREIAVRTAMGAGRTRIAGQLLTESVLLALMGGVLGLVFSIWGVKALVGMMPAWFPMRDQIAINGRAMVYTALITLGSGVLFGLAPALQASRPNLSTTLREGGRGSTVGGRRARLRNGLVIAEIALALVLMISAGLLVKSAVGLQSTPLGFDPAGLTTLRVALPAAEYPDTARVTQFYQTVVARIAALPGVTGAGAVRCTPLNCGMSTSYVVEGEPEPEPDKRPSVQFRSVTPEYLSVLGVRLLRGRALEPTDRQGSAPVMLINETMARRHWSNTNPLGQRLRFDNTTRGGSQRSTNDGPITTREIVGVVSDVREFGPDDEIPPMVFFPEYQVGDRGMTIVVRSGLDLERLLPALRGEVWAVNARLPVFDVRTMDDVLQDQMGGDLILAKLLGFFAVAALLLAVLGVYGVMAYSVSQRTQEMGIRMAIGAQRRDILRLVVRQGSRLAALGLGIGLLITLGVTRTLSAFLFGVSAFDVSTFAGVTVALALSALAASYIPALRATRVDPLVALRSE